MLILDIYIDYHPLERYRAEVRISYRDQAHGWIYGNLEIIDDHFY